MDTENFLARIGEPQFATYKKEYDELILVLETCNQNTSAAQAKIDDPLIREPPLPTRHRVRVRAQSHRRQKRRARRAGAPATGGP